MLERWLVRAGYTRRKASLRVRAWLTEREGFHEDSSMVYRGRKRPQASAPCGHEYSVALDVIRSADQTCEGLGCPPRVRFFPSSLTRG